MAIFQFSQKGAPLGKGCKNNFSQTFHLKGLWVQMVSKKANSITLLQIQIQEYSKNGSTK